MVRIPVTLEQLITAVQQLSPAEQAQVARALVDAGLRSDLAALIQELYAQPPADDISDDAIKAEIRAVCRQDDDLRADDELRAAMEAHGIQLLGVQSFLNSLEESQ